MKLKTAIEYWSHLNLRPINGKFNYKEQWDRFGMYISFLKQLLQLWMFIPCDKDGKPLEKPKYFDHYNEFGGFGIEVIDVYAIKEYQQACDRKIFTGFELAYTGIAIISITNEFTDVRLSFDKYSGKNGMNKTVEDLSGKVDLVEKVAETFKYE